jgi:site-specific recombinase XerD
MKSAQKTVEQLAVKAPEVLQQYFTYLSVERGLCEGTIHNRKGPLVFFFKKHRKYGSPQGLKELTSHAILRYIRWKSPQLSNENKKALSVALRSFLKFAYLKEYSDRDLSCCIPNIVNYRLGRVPKALPWKTVKSLLKIPDRRRSIGRRDYAILLLFTTYGVRRKQVTDLLLKDINWREGSIHFRAMKGGKSVLVPMSREVGTALLDYIRKDRMGDSVCPNVFVKHQTGPSRGQPLGRALWFMVSRHLEKVGYPEKSRFRGPHAIRHSFATQLVKQKTPFKTVSDLLGHRSLSTTMIYTKIDVDQMRALVPEWPASSSEVVR